MRNQRPQAEPTPSTADSRGSSRLYLAPTVDDLSRGSPGRDPPRVSALVVVVADVALELRAQAHEADLEEARERRPPALLEDRAVQPLDVPVGLRAAGANARVAGVELRQSLCEACGGE